MYMAEINFIDGFYDPSYFGETNILQVNGILKICWVISNGYYLNF